MVDCRYEVHQLLGVDLETHRDIWRLRCFLIAVMNGPNFFWALICGTQFEVRMIRMCFVYNLVSSFNVCAARLLLQWLSPDVNISMDVIWSQWYSILSWVLNIQLLSRSKYVYKKMQVYIYMCVCSFETMPMNQLPALFIRMFSFWIGWVSIVLAKLKSKSWGFLFKNHVTSCGSFLITVN